jgi:Spy/CpxP family protein refolding chaperone
MKAIFALLTMTVLALFVSAQTPPKPPSAAEQAQQRLKFLTSILTLTSVQQEQATTIFGDAAISESALDESRKATQDALSTAVRANDIASIEQAASTVGQLTAQSTSVTAKADAAFYQILTKEQQSKFAQMLARMPGPPPGGGPGGPGTGGFSGDH